MMQNQKEKEEREEMRQQLKEFNQKIKTPFKAFPSSMKSTQASRFYQGYARKKREALEGGNEISQLKPSMHSMASARDAKVEKPLRASATMSAFSATEKGSSFAR